MLVPVPRIIISSRAPKRVELLYKICIKATISGQTEGGPLYSNLKVCNPQLKISLEMMVPAPRIIISSRAPKRVSLLFNFCIKVTISCQKEGDPFIQT
jgi:hypothetical protein